MLVFTFYYMVLIRYVNAYVLLYGYVLGNVYALLYGNVYAVLYG